MALCPYALSPTAFPARARHQKRTALMVQTSHQKCISNSSNGKFEKQDKHRRWRIRNLTHMRNHVEHAVHFGMHAPHEAPLEIPEPSSKSRPSANSLSILLQKAILSRIGHLDRWLPGG